MSLGTILLIVLMLIGAFPTWPHGRNWGYGAQWWAGCNGDHHHRSAVAGTVMTGRSHAAVRLMRPCSTATLIGVMVLALAACGEVATLPISAGTGPQPTPAPPQQTLIPTVYIAPAKGWPPGATPLAAADTRVAAFASGLDHPRWLYVLPNGDVLVAETNAPPEPEDAKGIKGWLMGLVMKRAGATVPSANRITLLRDSDGGGVANLRSVLLEGLNSPFGMALVGCDLYVANSDAVLRFPYSVGATRITAPGIKVVDLPAGPINLHWTKNLIVSPNGAKLYVTVGSNSNVAERGMAVEAERSAIW